MGTPQAGTGAFTRCPHSLQMMGKRFPAAARLSSGKAWQVKLGEGCHNPVACDLLQAPSSSFSQWIPAPSLHASRRGLGLPRVTPLPPACSLQHFCRAEGVQSCRGFRLFKAVGRQHPGLDVGSSSTWLLPAWRILFCHLCAGASPAPSCSTCCQRGVQGKGTAKRR